MSTKAYYPRAEIGPGQVGFSKTRSIIEAPFYGNNVIKVNTLKEAYELAKNSPGTVVTDMPVYRGEEFGLEPDAKVLLFNDGSITGRYAPARRITGKPGVDTAALDKIVMDAVYDTRWKTMYHAEVFIGLDPEFMVKAHLLIPEGEENLLYNWMLNFQYMSTEYVKMYKNSKPVGDGKEPDIYIFSDPQWTGAPGQEKVCDPKCLCYFNTETNCAAILGMRYFGEHKKGTLTLAWAIANRNGYASCHGGQKEYTLADGHKFVSAVFGLSGSGKSTLTHAKHGGKYPSIKVLHDDAFIINSDTCASIALEPTYFDKTADYPVDSPDNKYLLTAQNCSATLDEDGKVVLVTEDIRNGNGRAIKSKLWSPNRVDKIESPVNAIFWIMKDPTIPPVVKLKGASLASVMGATLATKRSTAERLAPGIDPNALVVEPYANPFRTYPLVNDYVRFKKLVEEKIVDGWDDPRLVSIAALRRRGYTPESIQKFVELCGISKANSSVDYAMLEYCIREDLKMKRPRMMAVLDPVKVVIDNYPEGQVEYLPVDNNLENPELGSREVPFTRELYIEREDFMEEPPKKYFRMFPGNEVRLMNAYFVKCIGFEKDANGKVTEIHCTYDPASKGGNSPDGRKVKGTIHWVSAEYGKKATVRLYENIVNEELGVYNEDGSLNLNPNSLTVLNDCIVEPALMEAKEYESFQFVRQGFFCADCKDSKPGAPVFNRIVSLKSSFKLPTNPA